VNKPNDQRLIQAAQRGCRESFYQLTRGFDWQVLQLALRITGTQQAARSIYSETMLSMHARVTTFRLECSLCLCAYRIVSGLCLEYLRRENTVAGPTHRGIGRAIASLSPRERIVFELKHYHGLDLRTVGRVLDIPEDLARNVLLRACQKLRAAASAS
jgi:RNA polymerase sigma-70 factor (ECF subfamily)